MKKKVIQRTKKVIKRKSNILNERTGIKQRKKSFLFVNNDYYEGPVK